jgi:hypothetical protein
MQLVRFTTQPLSHVGSEIIYIVSDLTLYSSKERHDFHLVRTGGHHTLDNRVHGRATADPQHITVSQVLQQKLSRDRAKGI